MFNEFEMATLEKVLRGIHATRPTAFLFELKIEELVAALDIAGVAGLAVGDDGCSDEAFAALAT